MSEPLHFFGMDVGGTNVKMVAVTEDGKVIDRGQFPTHDSPLAQYAEEARNRLEEWSQGWGRPAGIGVASPGLIHADHRSVAWMGGRMESVNGFDWTDYLRSTVVIPVLNDAKAALVAEAWIGAAKGSRNAVLLTLGTGVGGAAIVDGRLLHGALGRAGHLGHISLDPAGPRDIVGTPGSLEDLVGDATIRTRSAGAFASTRGLLEAVQAGHEAASEIWRCSIRDLAAGIVSIINVLDPEIVILGGGISAAGDSLFLPLQTAMADIEWRPFGEGVRIVPAILGEYAGAIGAARFAMTYPSDPIHGLR